MIKYLFLILAAGSALVALGPGWATVAAELAIAAVIYLELEQNRVDAFVPAAFDIKARDERAKIYRLFLETVGRSLEEKREQFLQRLLADPGLRQFCDQQITEVNRIAVVATAGLSFVARRRIIKLFPHTALFYWAIFGPYIQRRRADTRKMVDARPDILHDRLH